jgi:hypothetical protein
MVARDGMGKKVQEILPEVFSGGCKARYERSKNRQDVLLVVFSDMMFISCVMVEVEER